MKRYITILAAFLLASCSSDDAEIITPSENINQEQAANIAYYYIRDTNIEIISVNRLRDGVWESKPEWSSDGKIPVKEKDFIKITSSGETTTADKQLFLSYTGDGVTGTAEALQIGQELIWEDVIGKPY